MNGRRGASMDDVARALAADLSPAIYVNIGIGLPQLVGRYIDSASEIVLHCENGLLGIGPAPQPGQEDLDYIDAGKTPITVAKGSALMHHADSFALIRSGRLDMAIMGALQVAANGDLSNWWRNDGGVPAVGGAMDLAIGAKRVVVIMTHVAMGDDPKLVRSCSIPLTGRGIVDRIYTNFGIFEPRGDSFEALAIAPGVTIDEVRELTGAPVVAAAGCRDFLVAGSATSGEGVLQRETVT